MPFRFTLHRLSTRNVLFNLLLSVTLLAGCGGNPQEDGPEDGKSAIVETGAESRGKASTGTTEAHVERRGRVLFFGDSITAGSGLDPEEAFPALLQKNMDDAGLPFVAINAGVSGETTAGGLRRIDWVLREPIDVFVLELGGNDGLRGIHPMGTAANLKAIIEKVTAANPDASIILAGMRMPPNLGRQFAADFAAVFPSVADQTNATLIPFIGENVVGHDDLVQRDGIHPTAEGHEVVAATVWKYLHPVLSERTEGTD